MKIGVSRAVVAAALSGALDAVRVQPRPGVQGLSPRASAPASRASSCSRDETWPDRAAYDAKARELAALFNKNFEQYAAECAPEVRAAGPE